MISKMILSSNELGCSEEILTIAAILSIQVHCFIPLALVDCNILSLSLVQGLYMVHFEF